MKAQQSGKAAEAADRTDSANVKFNLVVGGSVGNDPYDPRTWSGSGLRLLRALEQANALDHAIGLALPQWQDLALKFKNFSLSRRVWRLNFYLDTTYRNALTRSAAKRLVESESSPFVQIGAMYCVARATRGRIPCFSYHDGNIVEALKSGYGFEGVAAKRVDEAVRYERDVAREMTAVFTFSEYLRRSFIEEFGVDEKRVFNVGGGINIDDMPVPAAEKRYDTREILFVGVDFARKGGRELLSAFGIVRETLTDARLHIVGPHQLPYSGERPGVTFHGNLSKSIPDQRKKLYQLYRQASVFALPSKYEPFGVAPLEAMLFEVPCVVTDGWALREFVTPAVNGALVEKGSVDSLATTLLSLLKAPQRLGQMGKRGREIVLSNYTWPNVVTKMRMAAAAALSVNA